MSKKGVLVHEESMSYERARMLDTKAMASKETMRMESQGERRVANHDREASQHFLGLISVP